ncbi:LXG domain-containing protein [Rossellomorea aquimaris]|nr:LXG domain-containing protein [Rossellomorea aquimaris]WRP06298.1 LXG domain-containing protein [Rossellomorea aquimaris]
MKILDSQSLHNGIDELTSMLSTKLEQIEKLENEIAAFTHLNDSFEGKGGESIRSFYQDFHQKILSAYAFTLENYERILNTINSAAKDLEPDQTGYIDQSFLSNDLNNGLRKGENLATELVDEANSAISRVSDIVYAPALQEDRFMSLQRQAHRKIDHTVEDLSTFDSVQTKELDSVERDIQMLRNYLLEVNGMFESGNLEIEKYQPSQLNKLNSNEQIDSFVINNQLNDLGEKILNPFELVNSKLSLGDNILAGYQTFSIFTTSILSRNLSINYLGSKPTLWEKVRGKYKFSVKMNPSWTSKTKHSSPLAKKLIHFSRQASPSNPLLGNLQKFVQSYESPSHLYKHIAGFPKNSNVLTGAELSKGTLERMKTGSKELLSKAANVKGLTTISKRIPLVANVISFASNFGEFTDPENSDKSTFEKGGRFLAGWGTDVAAIGIGAKVGATIGSIGGPVGIVVGGAVGGLVGGLASSKYGDKVKDLGGSIGKSAEKGLENVKELSGKITGSVASWFN